MAFILSYTRIYLGVHYPGDILAGLIIGCLSALTCWSVFIWVKRMMNKRNLLQKEPATL
ncbi:MAG: phosphatase PAP2 family protein [Cyclobacteriaceae bacterium]